ncbi:hypothetical protein C3943_06610 [Lysinibacillus sp. B2A1]|nr:hypothetical protein C3943_06610 [Lysinibacillus sp. B2A1]
MMLSVKKLRLFVLLYIVLQFSLIVFFPVEASDAGKFQTILTGFSQPEGIAVDKNGNIYVTDAAYNCIWKFKSDNSFINKWCDQIGGQPISNPKGIAVDTIGNIYITNSNDATIQKFKADGTHIKTWGGHGAGNGQFDFPSSIAIDAAGNIYIADTFNIRIQKFTSDGVYLTNFYVGYYPYSITIDKLGNLYVANTDALRKYKADGTYLMEFNRDLNFPDGIVVDADNNVYVVDRVKHRIQKYASDGTYLTQWGTHGQADGQFFYPTQIAIDTVGNLYVTDMNNKRVQKMTPLPSDANLSELKMNTFTLPLQPNQQVVVGNDTSTLTITATAADPLAKINIEGKPTSIRTLSYQANLNVGNNVIPIVVTAQDGHSKKKYTLTIMRLPSSDATLKNLTVNHGVLSPTFVANEEHYILQVEHAVSTLQITAETTNDEAGMTINGNQKTSETIALVAGQTTTIPIVVTAQNGVTQKTYTLAVTRALSDDATLKSIAVDHGTLSPAFTANEETYTLQVEHGVTAINVAAQPVDSQASVTINGSEKTSETIALVAGQTTTIPIVVTAQNGVTQKTYTLAVTRALSDDATLKSIAVDHGTLSPAFTANEETYTLQVEHGVTAINVAAQPVDSQASVTINGSEKTSETIALVAGQTTTIPIVVTAQNGVTQKTYTLAVTRVLSDDATLKSIAVDHGTLSPAFTANEETYTLQVEHGVTAINVAALPLDSQASVTINGSEKTSETIALAAGQTTTISIIVTAQDGKTQKTYTMTVTRAPSSDATLQSLTVSNGMLSPAFMAHEENYTVQVEHSVTTLDVAAITTDSQASLTINGNHTTSETVTLLAGQIVTIPVVVTAEDGITQKTYTLIIARAPSSDTTLQSLTVDNGIVSPSFQPAITMYTVRPDVAASTLRVTALPTNADASVMINGHTTTADTITLTMSQPMTIPIIVTAQNGEQSVYTLLVQETFIPVASIMVQPTQLQLQVGGSPVALNATVYPTDASNPRVSWRSKNQIVATVDEHGRVTPKSAGVAEIVVTTVDGGQLATALITVEQVIAGNESTPSPAPIQELIDNNNFSPPVPMKITFHTNGGAVIEPIEMAYNTKVSDLPVPTKEGYRFDGWYQDEALTKLWAKEMLVKENLTLYAKWTALPVEEPEAPKEPQQPSQPKPSVVTFQDIENHWAQEMIEALATQGIIKGYEDGTFRPNESISRQHVASLFTRAFEFEGIRPTGAFSDVAPNHMYYDAIMTLQQAGIIDGADGAFRPTDNITRAQLAKILANTLQLKSEGTSSFKDVDSNHWSVGYIAALERAEIALGDNGKFHPEASVTRAQLAAFLYRAMQQ